MKIGTRLGLAAAGLALIACGAAHAADKTLVVWDFKSSEPLMKPYFDYVKKTFEAEHPGVVIQEIAQPADKYYTVLGTAINAKQGPDVVLLNGGNLALDRADALVPLNDKTADILPNLAGMSAFTKPDGTYIALPLTVQGSIWYYNKEVYKDAGLDPNKAPVTWADFSANCEAIKTKTKASCLTFGNKDGTDMINIVASTAEGIWSNETRAKFIAHDLAWTSPEMHAVFDKVKEMIDKGWIEKGVNSYSPYTDAVNIFAGARTGHLLGLISDAPNSWKNLEDLTGPGGVGVIIPLAIANDKPNRLEVDGGIGFAITSWSPNQDLALDYVKTSVSPKAGAALMQSAGGLPSNTKVDLSGLQNESGKEVVRLLGCCTDTPRIKSNYVTAERQELQRVGQLLVTGDISVDDALNSIEAVRQKERARTK